jgi:site-specific recombinase XerC
MDWTRADAVVRSWEVEGAQPTQSVRTTIEEWEDAFLADASSPAGKNLNPETLRKYKLLFRQINEFAIDRGLRYVNQLNLHELTAFRSRWEDAPLSASKKLERLRSILKFALRRKWINENPATDLDPPKIKPIPTLPFTADEMQRILKAATDPRVHTFILVMRYSGLRIAKLRCTREILARFKRPNLACAGAERTFARPSRSGLGSLLRTTRKQWDSC